MARRNRTRSSVFTDPGELDVAVCERDISAPLDLPQPVSARLRSADKLGDGAGNDVRSRALTMGKIADILESRGDLDEALRIRGEEQLPVYERLGDVRARRLPGQDRQHPRIPRRARRGARSTGRMFTSVPAAW
jgi:hypothetical protein